MHKIKIIIAGIGGVGGYFGGLMAKEFENSSEVEVNFMARGEHLSVIQQHGLRIIKGENQWTVKPYLATNDPSKIGKVNFIIVCTKSYDLESTINQLKPCITKDTIILPLLNGVDGRERILKMYPHNVIADGCVYIVSRLKEPGVIENIGNIQTLYFGLNGQCNSKLELLQKLFKQSGIESTLSLNIASIIWEKFIFISPTATATSYFDCSIGEILANEKKLKTISLLIEEVKMLANAKHINVPEDIAEKTLNKLKTLPFSSTSSMHSDFKNKKPRTELQSLTSYVIEQSKSFNLNTPTFEELFIELNRK